MKNLKILLIAMVCQLWAMEEKATDEISSHNPHIKKLDLSHDQSLTVIGFVRHFSALEEISLEEDMYLGNGYKPICDLINLIKVNLNGVAPTTLKPLRRLLNLQELYISQNEATSIAPLTRLPLKVLDLSFGWRIKDLHLLGRITTLTDLNISMVYSEEDNMQEYYPSLDCLKPLINLKKLNISGNYMLFKISPLLHLPQLEILDASMCMSIKDYPIIKDLSALKEVTLWDREPQKVGPLPSHIQLIIKP